MSDFTKLETPAYMYQDLLILHRYTHLNGSNKNYYHFQAN